MKIINLKIKTMKKMTKIFDANGIEFIMEATFNVGEDTHLITCKSSLNEGWSESKLCNGIELEEVVSRMEGNARVYSKPQTLEECLRDCGFVGVVEE
jgi:hypothetical protein